MSSFAERFNGCMSGKDLPAPVVQSAKEVFAFVRQVRSALKILEFTSEMTVAEFLTAAVEAGLISEGVAGAILAAGEIVADVMLAAYLAACIACVVSSVDLGDLRALVASNDDPDPFLTDQLAALGVDLGQAEDQSAVG